MHSCREATHGARAERNRPSHPWPRRARGAGDGILHRDRRRGARVAVHGHAHAQAEAVAASIRASGGTAFAVTGDVRSAAACAALVQDAHRVLGGLDVLVNNAGVVERRPLREVDDASYDSVVDLNARPVFACSRAALPFMEATGGAIIATTSLAARSGGGGGSVLCAASTISPLPSCPASSPDR